MRVLLTAVRAGACAPLFSPSLPLSHTVIWPVHNPCSPPDPIGLINVALIVRLSRMFLSYTVQSHVLKGIRQPCDSSDITL